MARGLRGSSLLGGGLAGIVPLLRNTRFEVFPASGIEDAVVQWVPADQTVTVTASPAKGLDATLGLTERLAARGFRVVPHVSARLVADDAHLADIVARLLARGLIHRRRAKEDGRAYAIKLTTQGWKGLRDAEPGAAATDSRLLAVLPPAKRQEFLDILNIIVATIAK